MEATAPAAADVSASAPETENVPHETPAFTPKKYKLKIDDREEEIEYKSEADLLADIQKGRASDKKFREAAELRKTAEEVLGQFSELKGRGIKGDLDWVIEEFGVGTALGWAQSLLKDKEKFDNLSPEEKAYLREKHAREEAEARLSDIEKRELEGKQRELSDKAFKEIDTDIAEALKSTGRKPTPRIVARMAEVMLAHLEAKGGNLPAAKAFDHVKSEMRSELSEYFSEMTPKEALEFLPKHLVDGIRKAQVDEVLSQNPMGSRNVSKLSERSAPKSGKFKRDSVDNWFSNLEKKWR